MFSSSSQPTPTISSSAASIGLCSAAAVAAGTVLFCYRSKVKNGRIDEQNKFDHKLTVTHELSELESFMYLVADMLPITTLTWFTGDFQAAKPLLEERMKRIIAKNPWIQGRVSVSSYWKGKCSLSYTKPKRRTSLEGRVNTGKHVNVIDPTDSPLSYDMPLELQNKTLLRSTIYTSEICIKNSPTSPIFKVSIIPCSMKPNEFFALVIQLSHVVGDGATYYKLIDMLCSTESDDEKEKTSIVELIPERIQNSVELQTAVMGKPEVWHCTSFGFIFLTILDEVMRKWKGKSQYKYGVISSNGQMDEMKVSAAKEAGLPYVSTNDVLTSWFMQILDSEHGLMAINWRSRLDGHTELHAGNYENCLFYQKADYATPGLIRQSLALHRRSVTGHNKYPPWWEIATSKCTLVTNWASFAKPNMIKGCREELHFPVVPFEAMPSRRLKFVIFFRAGNGKIGVLYPSNLVVGANDPFGLLSKHSE